MHFLEEKKHDRPRVASRREASATINRKWGIITFSVEAVKELGLGLSFIKFYTDRSSRAIGFKIRKELDDGVKVSRTGWRVGKVNEMGMVRFAIKNLLQEIPALDGETTYKDLDIKRYVDYQSPYGEKEPVYFVELIVESHE
jgi:hypothetical protein